MSVFKVNLNQAGQGLLDLNPTTFVPGTSGPDYLGDKMSTSVQRTVYIMGPGKVNRELRDGVTFTDSNYYKRYCAQPVGPLAPADAILTVVTDDGSTWFDDGTPSVAEKVANNTVSTNSSTALSTPGAVAGANTLDILGNYGGPATYIEIINTGSVALKVRFNGDVNAIMDLPIGGQQVFNNGDGVVSKLEFGNASGSTAGAVQTVFTVKSVSYS